MKLTIVQMKVHIGKEKNLKHLMALLTEPLDTDIIVLPEMWISPYQNDLFAQHAVTEGDDTYQNIQRIAQTKGAYLVAGSVPERDQGTMYNTTFVFDPLGHQIAKYRKIHLFEITYPDGTMYHEGDTISRGHDIVTVDTPFGMIGLLICFDIRFPLLAKKLQEQGASILIVPAAFNQFTGPHHWELAFRSRAVDNQLFTVGVSPSATSEGTYQYYGHSIVVNPFGEVIHQMGEEEKITTIELDLSDVSSIRKAFPILFNEIVI